MMEGLGMILPRRSQERGHFNYGWLDTYHTFSFADYHDPAHMGFSSLRVINEDRLAPGAGFAAHRHRDMEIITYMLEGALEHKDSLGHGSVIRPGEVQRMSAGSGIEHSEYNASKVEPAHFLQIWITPAAAGLPPSYEQKRFAAAGGLTLVATPDGRAGALTIHSDAMVYAARLRPDETVSHALAAGRRAYVQVARGETRINGAMLAAGDGARVSDEREMVLQAGVETELLLFDLA